MEFLTRGVQNLINFIIDFFYYLQRKLISQFNILYLNGEITNYANSQNTIQLPPLNSFRSIYYIKVKLLRKVQYENIYIFQPQKRIVSAENVRGNTVGR